MLRGPGVALIVICLLVAGCDGSSPRPKPSATIPAAKPIPEAGQCFAKEVPDLDDFAPDLESRVDCTEPHVYEVTAVADVPTQLVKGKTPKQLVALRKKLATVDDGSDEVDEVQKKHAERVDDTCGPAHRQADGLSKLKLNGKSAEDASVIPAIKDADHWLNVLDAGNWAKGNTMFLCLVRYSKPYTTDELPDPRSVRSRSSDPVEQSYLSKGYPLRHRQCVTLRGRGDLVPCDKQHQGEMLFSFDARPVLGTKFVESIGLDKPSKKQAKTLNRICIDALPTFLGDGYDGDLTAVAELGGAGWIAQGDFYPTDCIVVGRNSKLDLPGGSLIGDAKQVDLVPAGQSQVAWLRSRSS